VTHEICFSYLLYLLAYLLGFSGVTLYKPTLSSQVITVRTPEKNSALANDGVLAQPCQVDMSAP
jgi:hypothetical protein